MKLITPFILFTLVLTHKRFYPDLTAILTYPCIAGLVKPNVEYPQKLKQKHPPMLSKINLTRISAFLSGVPLVEQDQKKIILFWCKIIQHAYTAEARLLIQYTVAQNSPTKKLRWNRLTLEYGQNFNKQLIQMAWQKSKLI